MAGDRFGGRTGKRGNQQRLSNAGKKHGGVNSLRFGASDAKCFKPAGPPSNLDNGWQLLQTGVQDRVTNIFNCKTLSDLILVAEGREIPAHTLIIASASPVFYHRLFEASVEDDGAPKWARLWECQLSQEFQDRDGQQSSVNHAQGMPPRGTPSCPLRIHVNFKFEPFYEFLRYLYTDEADVTIENAAHLLYMADDFKVPDLFEKCLKFLHDQVAPSTALRLLITFRQLLCKAIMTSWRELIDHSKAEKHFTELDFAERRARFEEYKTGNSSRMMSRVASNMSSHVEDDKMSVISARTNTSVRKPEANEQPVLDWNPPKRRSVLEAVEFDASQVRSVVPASQGAELAAFGLKEVFQLTDAGRRLKFLHAAKVLQAQLAHEARESVARCWRCFQKDSEEVLESDHLKHLEISQVQEVLSCKNANALEIHFFRALNAWVEHQCRLRGLPYLPEHRRELLGEETIQLIRFPLLTLEEVLWEVAPTGMLDFEDLQILKQIKRGSVDATASKFNATPRKQMAEIVGSLRLDRQDVQQMKDGMERQVSTTTECSEGASLGGATYKPAVGDAVDHYLASKLYRDHVFDSVVAHQESRFASEAGVGLDPERRPIFCGEIKVQQLPDSFKNMELAVMGTNRPKMLFLRQELKTQALPMSESAQERYRQQASSTDFRRISPGVYNFRGERTLEMRFEGGEPYIYESTDRPATVAEIGHRPPSEASVGQRPHSVAGVGGETGAALRARLANMRRVPLDGFLARSAPV